MELDIYKELEKFNPDQVLKLIKFLNIQPIGVQEFDTRRLAKILATILDPDMHKKCLAFTNYNIDDIDKIRQKIADQYIIYKNNVSALTEHDLLDIIKLYDLYCLNNTLFQTIKLLGHSLVVKLTGNELFTTTSFCIHACAFTIIIPMHYFKRVKPGNVTRVAGHDCNSQFECLLFVIEHELTHLIIFMVCNEESVSNHHGKLFMDTINKLWKHTDIAHYMI